MKGLKKCYLMNLFFPTSDFQPPASKWEAAADGLSFVPG